MKKITRIYSEIKSLPGITAFLAVLVVVLIINFSNSYPFVFYHDAKYYWDLSDTFLIGGKFSFLNYDYKIRGYLFPFVIFLIKRLAQIVGINADLFYVILMSTIYALLITLWLPNLIEIFLKKKIFLLERIVFSALFCFFWSSYVFYPMSDLLPVLLLVIGALLMNSQRWYGVIAAGVLICGMPLIRPAYLISLPFFTIWFIVLYYREFGLSRVKVGSFVILFLLGGAIVCAPQYWINLQYYGVKYPFVRSEVGGKSLLISQLRWGVTLQKYETNVGISYPNAGVFFIDRYGASILEKEGFQEAFTDNSDFTFPTGPVKMSEYVKLVVKYPMDFLFIYLRHFFNGLDVVYNSVYVKDVYSAGLFTRLANYSVWFFALLYIIGVFRSVSMAIWNDTRLLYLTSFMLSSLSVIPTAVEVRFMIPIQVVAYAIVSFGLFPDLLTRNIIQQRDYFFKYLPQYMIFVGVCFSFSLNTYLGLQFGPYFLSH